MFKLVNGYEDIDRNMFFKIKEGSRTREHKAAIVKEQCRLDMRNLVPVTVTKLPNKLFYMYITCTLANAHKTIIYVYI